MRARATGDGAEPIRELATAVEEPWTSWVADLEVERLGLHARLAEGVPAA